MTSAVRPPVEVAPATMTAIAEMHTGNLESSRSPRTRVCSQIEDRRGDLLECWTKPTT